VLLFVDNPTTSEKLLLQLVDSAVLFEFSVDTSTTCTVRSAPLQPGFWYRLSATRSVAFLVLSIILVLVSVYADMFVFVLSGVLVLFSF